MGILSGELELPVMQILWDKGPLRGKDVHGEIRRAKGIAYTTALTVLDRLAKKGFVRKDRSSGTILFRPAIGRDEYQAHVTEGLVLRAFEVSPELAISAFTGLFSRMRGEELDLGKLEKLIAEKKNAGRS